MPDTQFPSARKPEQPDLETGRLKKSSGMARDNFHYPSSDNTITVFASNFIITKYLSHYCSSGLEISHFRFVVLLGPPPHWRAQSAIHFLLKEKPLLFKFGPDEDQKIFLVFRLFKQRGFKFTNSCIILLGNKSMILRYL